ncbi:hypothetical protein [Noviherbaspirillum humi]|nr:hypothetical protein [Noviherbaspirillum humi]
MVKGILIAVVIAGAAGGAIWKMRGTAGKPAATEAAAVPAASPAVDSTPPGGTLSPSPAEAKAPTELEPAMPAIAPATPAAPAAPAAEAAPTAPASGEKLASPKAAPESTPTATAAPSAPSLEKAPAAAKPVPVPSLPTAPAKPMTGKETAGKSPETLAAVQASLDEGADCFKRKKFDCSISSAKAALRLDPRNGQALDLQRRAREAQEKALSEIEIK